MKVENYLFPKSSFLSVDKDLEIITDKILKNNNLKKLLFYNTRDALDQPKLTEDESLGLFGENIRIVPKLPIDYKVKNYLFIKFDNFFETYNPEFRENLIEFDIFCNYECWQLKDFQLRPYRIMAELDTIFAGQYLTGIGQLEFVSATFVPVDDILGGFCLTYRAIHGEEDKKFAPNPIDEEQLIKNFNEVFNQ